MHIAWWHRFSARTGVFDKTQIAGSVHASKHGANIDAYWSRPLPRPLPVKV